MCTRPSPLHCALVLNMFSSQELRNVVQLLLMHVKVIKHYGYRHPVDIIFLAQISTYHTR